MTTHDQVHTPIDVLEVERLRISILSAPLDAEGVPMSFGRLRDRRTCLVEVCVDGVWGVGESWVNHPPWITAERVLTYREGVAPLLVGRDVGDPARVLEDLAAALLPLGRQSGAPGPIWQALSGLDLALWDLRGKLAGRPVHQLLGSGRSSCEVPVYGSGIGPTAVEELCANAMRQGLRAVKTKIGFSREVDERTLAATRAEVGEEVELFADANQAWSLPEAMAATSWLAAHDVGWLEEPLAGDRVGELRELAAATGMPLATGENVYGAEEFSALARSGGIRVLQPDLAKSGGFSVLARVADAAGRAGVRLAPHCYSGAVALAASAHLVAAYPHADWLELDVRHNPLRSRLLSEPWDLVDGSLRLPDRPGLGIELDPDVVDRYCVHQEELF